MYGMIIHFLHRVLPPTNNSLLGSYAIATRFMEANIERRWYVEPESLFWANINQPECFCLPEAPCLGQQSLNIPPTACVVPFTSFRYVRSQTRQRGPESISFPVPIKLLPFPSTLISISPLLLHQGLIPR